MGNKASVRTFSPADRLLALLSLARPDPGEKNGIEAILAQGVDFREFEKKVAHNDIAPMIWRHAHNLELLSRFPSETTAHLKNRHAEITTKNLLRREKSSELFQAFREHGIEVIVLKGVLFAETLYGDVGYKKMNDLDILIRHRDLPVIKQVYRDLDIVPLALFESGDETESPTKSYHLPAYVSKDLSLVIGTHWNLCSPKTGFTIAPEPLWDNSVSTTIAGQPVRALAATDALLHLVVHFHYYKTGLKELADFVNLIRSVCPFPWETFSQKIGSAKAWTPAFRTLTILNCLFPRSVPAKIRQRFRDKADKFVVRDTERLICRPDLLLTSRSVYSSHIEKAYLRYSFEQELWPKIRCLSVFWYRLLFPPAATLYRTNSCSPREKPLPWLWTMNVWRTSREIGQNYGMGIFLLLMLKSAWELALTASSFLRGPTLDPLAALRKEFGGDEKRLQELMNSME
jgi:hypothetical protein